jgi:hypothetical protein
MNYVEETEEQLAQATELLSRALDAIPECERNMELIDKISKFLGIEPDDEEEENDEDD